MSEQNLTTPTTEVVKKTTRKTTIPKAQQDLASVALTVADHYSSFGVELSWLSKAQFAQMASDFSTGVKTSLRERAHRQPLSREISDLMKEMNQNLHYVKDAISLKFGRANKTAHYADFGLVHYKKSWRLAVDYTERVNGLESMIDSFNLHGIGNFDHGTLYWQDLYTRFKAAVELAVDTDSTRTVTVGNKNEIQEELRTALNSLIHLIKAEYPKTYKTHLREWGFQKEKY